MKKNEAKKKKKKKHARVETCREEHPACENPAFGDTVRAPSGQLARRNDAIGVGVEPPVKRAPLLDSHVARGVAQQAREEAQRLNNHGHARRCRARRANRAERKGEKQGGRRGHWERKKKTLRKKKTRKKKTKKKKKKKKKFFGVFSRPAAPNLRIDLI
jgi:hypothetical protein